MRVLASGNLTVELIRAQRFDVAHRPDTLDNQPQHLRTCDTKPGDDRPQPIDRVELSPQAIEYDPWATPTDRANHAIDPILATELNSQQGEQPIEPKHITPVVGSPALAGLGVALVVPGTLLDVVA